MKLDVERLAVAINDAQIMGPESWGRDLLPVAEKVARLYERVAPSPTEPPAGYDSLADWQADVRDSGGVAPSPDAPGLREALRAVLRDFDREPTEEYLTEAVRRFLGASGVAPSPDAPGPHRHKCQECGQTLNDEWLRRADEIEDYLAGVAPSPDAPGLRLTGEQIGSITPPPEGDWFVDWDEYEEFVPKRLLDAARVAPSPTVDDLSVALQRGGALSPSHMTYHDLARCVLAALRDGRDDLGAPDEHTLHDYGQGVAPSPDAPGSDATPDLAAEEKALAAVMRRVGCTVNVDMIAYYLVREGVRVLASEPVPATPDLAAALERLAAKVPGVEPFRDVPGYGPCWCEGWERGYHEGWHHSEVCKRNRDDAEAITEFRAALASEPVPRQRPDRGATMKLQPMKVQLGTGTTNRAELTMRVTRPKLNTRSRRAIVESSKLTPREIDVLGRVVEGMTNDEIAGALRIDRWTAKNHVASIMKKLDVSSRTAAAVWYVRTFE